MKFQVKARRMKSNEVSNFPGLTILRYRRKFNAVESAVSESGPIIVHRSIYDSLTLSQFSQFFGPFTKECEHNEDWALSCAILASHFVTLTLDEASRRMI